MTRNLRAIRGHYITDKSAHPVITLFPSQGSVGDAISVMRPDVYVSDDGGYTWIKALDGPHHYAILDSGGLLVAVEHNKQQQPINTIK